MSCVPNRPLVSVEYAQIATKIRANHSATLTSAIKPHSSGSLVDLEGFAAVGADDFVHGDWSSSCWLDW